MNLLAGLRRVLSVAGLREIATLAAPTVLVQVGLMSMGVVDTMMAGRISAHALAAAALGNLYVVNVLVFGMGLLLALDPLVSQAVGAGDDRAVTLAVQRGMLLAAALTVVTSLVLVPAGPALAAMRQPADAIPDAARYAHVSIAGIFPFLAFIVLRQTLQAHGRMRPIVLVVLAANAANAALNWVFMFGHLGVRALGAVGSAWSTAIGRWLMAIGLLAVAWRELAPRIVPGRDAFAAEPLRRTIALGVPIGCQMVLEVGAFGVTTALMGLFGAVPLAGHEVVLNLASLTFMVPLGVGGAAAVLVGRSIGAGDPRAARWHAAAALVCGVGFMTLSAVAFTVAPALIARAYTTDPDVIAVAVTLLPIAALFQVFDGAQAVASGVLRGTGDTSVPAVAYLVGFWVIGIPVSAVLAFSSGAGPAGLWWGTVIGLVAVSALLLTRVWHRVRGDLSRLDVGDRAEPAS